MSEDLESDVSNFYSHSENQLETINIRDIHDDFPDEPPPPPQPQHRKNIAGQKRKQADVSTRRWTWSSEMVESLLLNLNEYKSSKTFEGLDFEADFIKMYGDLRSMMSRMYPVSDFGPESIPAKEETETNMEYKKRVEQLDKSKKEGYARIKNKIRELRRGYKHAVDKGTRSGSGRLVAGHYNILKEIWGGCPSVTAIPQGKVSLNIEEDNIVSEDEESEAPVIPEEGREAPEEARVIPEDKGKYKNMQKKLSAHQRDMVLVDLTREELEIKRQNTELLRKSLEGTEQAIKAMTESINSIGNGIKDGLGLLANAFLQSQAQPAPHPPYPYYNQGHHAPQYQQPFMSPPQTDRKSVV